MNKATLRLFSAIEVDNKQKKDLPESLLVRTIQNGYILDSTIQPTEELLNTIESIVGISGIKANSAFHKSWQIIQDSSIESLVTQQIIHYITTYGFESLGIYREDAVYIPKEILELPNITDDIPLVVIKAMTAEEILNSIVKLADGIALAQETLDDIMEIVKGHNYEKSFVEKIGNRELKALLLDFYGIVPSEPVEFLRHLISKLTDESLLIKNKYLIDKIKQSNGKFLDTLLKDAPEDLASIFFRFKPLFLAMKSISHNKTYFNQLRKKAKKQHKPLPEDYLNSITSQIKYEKLNLETLAQKLKKATIFRKIRLAYALKYRLDINDSIIYRVRNGRGWATEFDYEWWYVVKDKTQQALEIVINSIVEDVKRNVEGKTIYIPRNIHYALPATEKQFTGYFPTGTYVVTQEDMIVGIHWTNTKKNRVDLDLSVIGESGKIGWDADYYSEEKEVLFSGDMTDARAPDGASELFYLKQASQETRILMVNYFNFVKGDKVEAKILVAQEKPDNFRLNYMVDVNKIIASANITITKIQNILGIIVNINKENRVYFANISIGNSVTSGNYQQSQQARNYLVTKLVNSLELRTVLTMAGAKIIDEIPEDKEEEYINLSPEALDKTTIINLIRG
ncbi:hypothetical protein [Cyanobacterium sp. Dongsha4]|uniref:hypothetical protein n=1 Tax=Cyanobacterium sp. DS4 TaxID=2878255 RepID=UPI002E809985|nr:hypothetical protein [Cyanobacterium sp. Dongsha4]WVK99949.1 hypothetical protein Dongsha4_14965 [Cyanobacterium sp. Dongsha4]